VRCRQAHPPSQPAGPAWLPDGSFGTGGDAIAAAADQAASATLALIQGRAALRPAGT
jgi:hypothetical protein